MSLTGKTGLNGYGERVAPETKWRSGLQRLELLRRLAVIHLTPANPFGEHLPGLKSHKTLATGMDQASQPKICEAQISGPLAGGGRHGFERVQDDELARQRLGAFSPPGACLEATKSPLVRTPLRLKTAKTLAGCLNSRRNRRQSAAIFPLILVFQSAAVTGGMNWFWGRQTG